MKVAQVQDNDKPVLIYVTYPTPEAAEATGRALVEERLAGCVNIIAGMTAIYRWEGAIERDSEVVLIVKTRQSLAEAVVPAVRSRHPYTNPAILIVPVIGGSKDYIDWLMAGTEPSRV